MTAQERRSIDNKSSFFKGKNDGASKFLKKASYT